MKKFNNSFEELGWFKEQIKSVRAIPLPDSEKIKMFNRLKEQTSQKIIRDWIDEEIAKLL